jgi:hypothetical protein
MPPRQTNAPRGRAGDRRIALRHVPRFNTRMPELIRRRRPPRLLCTFITAMGSAKNEDFRSMNEQRHRFAWPIVDPVERLRGRVPRVRLKDMPQSLPRTVQGNPIVIAQAIVLKHAFKFQQLGEYGVAVHVRRLDDSATGVLGIQRPPVNVTVEASRLAPAPIDVPCAGDRWLALCRMPRASTTISAVGRDKLSGAQERNRETSEHRLRR